MLSIITFICILLIEFEICSSLAIPAAFERANLGTELETLPSLGVEVGGAQLGYASAFIGDVDGNGVPDMAVSMKKAGVDLDGAVAVLLRERDGSVSSTAFLGQQFNETGTWTVERIHQLGFGTSIAPLGDVNGDGVPDILVGGNYGPAYDNGLQGRGGVFVCLLTPSGHLLELHLISNRDICLSFGDWSRFGSSIVVVPPGVYTPSSPANTTEFRFFAGAPRAVTKLGRVYLVTARYYMNTNVMECRRAITLAHGDESGPLSSLVLPQLRLWGTDIDLVSDVNGDGFDDLVVGAPDKDAVNGAVYVVYLNSNYEPVGVSQGNVSVPGVTGMGSSVRSLHRDLDGDGIDELLVGSEVEQRLFVVSMHGNGTLKDWWELDLASRLAQVLGGSSATLLGHSLALVPGTLPGPSSPYNPCWRQCGGPIWLAGVPDTLDTPPINGDLLAGYSVAPCNASHRLPLQDSPVCNELVQGGNDGGNTGETPVRAIRVLDDVNGDGVADWLVGLPQARTSGGLVRLLFMNVDGGVDAGVSVGRGLPGWNLAQFSTAKQRTGSAVDFHDGLLFLGAPFGNSNERGALFAVAMAQYHTQVNSSRFVDLTAECSVPTVDWDAFGSSLAWWSRSNSSAVLVVGAPRSKTLTGQPGSIHFLQLSSDASTLGWSCPAVVSWRSGSSEAPPLLQALQLPDAARFGQSVAVSAPFLVVGAPGDESVYLFRLANASLLPESAPLRIGRPNDTLVEFGHSVAFLASFPSSSSTLLRLAVGAPGGSDGGVVVVLDIDIQVLSQPRLVAVREHLASEHGTTAPASNDRFGESIDDVTQSHCPSIIDNDSGGGGGGGYALVVAAPGRATEGAVFISKSGSSCDDSLSFERSNVYVERWQPTSESSESSSTLFSSTINFSSSSSSSLSSSSSSFYSSLSSSSSSSFLDTIISAPITTESNDSDFGAFSIEAEQQRQRTFTMAAGIGGGGAVLVVVATAALVFWRRRSTTATKSKSNESEMGIASSSSPGYQNPPQTSAHSNSSPLPQYDDPPNKQKQEKEKENENEKVADDDYCAPPQKPKIVIQADDKHIIGMNDVKMGKKLGEGAFGVVVKGEWRNVDVAVKQLKGLDADAAAQLQGEAQQLAAMKNHPNVVTFFGLVLEPSLAVVLEFCPGGSLDQALYGGGDDDDQKRRRTFTDEQIEEICLGIAKGVAHLHAEKVVHRDLAARNVLLDELDRPKVTDFGMSRAGVDEEDGKTQTTKTTVGPVKWMAPEQMSIQVVSTAADMWSFAVTVYEAVARSPPWPGQSNMEAAHQVMGGSHLAVPDHASPSLRRLMLECWHHDPNQRWSADQCVDFLRTSQSPSSSPALNKRSSPRRVQKKKSSSRRGAEANQSKDSAGE